MSIELQTFASGDTDYIAKLNADMADIEAAINALQQQADASAGGSSPLSLGLFFSSLFNGADALIGPNSYKPTIAATTLTVAPGGMYLQSYGGVVSSFTDTPLNFVGISVGTHYIVVSEAGIPARKSTQDSGSIYSVYWNGSSLSGLTYLVKVFYDTSEADGSRRSLELGGGSPPTQSNFLSLDARLEAGEAAAADALDKANSAMATAQTVIRKVGITVDASPGVKGAIQIDFSGTIIGWSVIGGSSGSLQVEVSRRASSPPPAAPQIPDPVSNKISAAAPIATSSAQSASGDAAAVASWSKTLNRWDVIQFSVVSMSVMSKATLYIRIQEEVAAINPLEEWSPPELPDPFPELPSPPEDVDL